MRPIRIGLSGIGRIGRNLFRILHTRSDVQIVAISDTAEPRALEYLLRYDTILGRFPDEVSIREGHLYVAGRQIAMLSGEQSKDERWGDFDVDIVVEATARPRSRAESERHLDAGAKRLILCVPPIDPPDITVVIGVNDDHLRASHRIVSNASCTAHCAAPVMKILHQAFGIERAFLSTVHAYTNQQRLADVPLKDKRRGRAAAENIIPQESNSGEMVMGLIPELAGRVSGSAMNVPVPNGSVVDLVCWHERDVTPLAINEVMRTAVDTDHWRKLIEYIDEPVVSSDIVRTPFTATFDSLATMTLGRRVSKTLTWYDNGWGYAHRVVNLIERFQQIDAEIGS